MGRWTPRSATPHSELDDLSGRGPADVAQAEETPAPQEGDDLPLFPVEWSDRLIPPEEMTPEQRAWVQAGAAGPPPGGPAEPTRDAFDGLREIASEFGLTVPGL